MNVPALPPLDADLVDHHARCHAELAAAVGAASPMSRALWTMLHRRLLVETLGYVQPVTDAVDALPLAAPPRAFLTLRHERRLRGAAAAFRHLDSRAAMVHAGLAANVLTAATPLVLNALLEGPLADGRETNPGMYRVTDTRWRPEANPFVHPAPGDCEALVEAAIDFVLRAPAPACARAAWLTFTMLSIHPFVDGNGRTARALYLAVVGQHLPLGVDWGVLERWSIGRESYVDALQAGQRCSGYHPDELDPLPFMTFATAASIDGAVASRERVAAIDGDVQRVRANGLSDDQAQIYVALRMLRGASVAELADAGLDLPRRIAAIDGLLASGAVHWTPRPHGRRTSDDRAEFALVAAD